MELVLDNPKMLRAIKQGTKSNQSMTTLMIIIELDFSS